MKDIKQLSDDELNQWLLLELYGMGASKNITPQFCTDIAEAWSLLEYHQKTHHLCVLNMISPTDDCFYWRVGFTKKWCFSIDMRYEDGEWSEQFSRASTAPRAICEAIAIAHGYNDPTTPCKP